MSKPKDVNTPIRIGDALAVLCRKTCHPGPFCPDGFCEEMWDEFRAARRIKAEPEHKTECLTEDEIKAIRIHMNAFKERLCNQHRWKEAEEYQQIVDKLDVMSPQSEPRWILCSERLPEQNTEVLVTRKFLGVKDPCGGWHAHLRPETYVETARLLGKVWVSDSDEYKVAPSRHADPVAWMPLPDPYKEEEE